MKADFKNNPILITGIERSGSSIIGKIISSCEVYTGQTTEMAENKALKKLVSSYYISVLKVPENGQIPLPKTNDLDIPITWTSLIEKILQKEGYTGDIPWMYKSSKVMQIWPVWNYSFPNAKYIIVRRRTPDIIQSCLKTGYMNAYDTSEGWLSWIHKQEKLFVEMIENGLNCKQIWPERMVNNDYSQVYEMLEWLGLSWNNEAIVDLVTPLLKNSTQKIKEGIR